MNEHVVRDFLQALRRVARQVGLYPAGHPLTAEALEAAEKAVRDLSSTGGEEAVIAVTEDSVYFNRTLLPHTSLEYNSLIVEMHRRGLESITVVNPVLGTDLFDLAAFVAGVSDDLPAGGTIKLNEAPVSGGEDGVLSHMRRSYAGSLGALRTATNSLAGEGAFDLQAVMESVEDLLNATLFSSSASLLLSTVKSHDEYTFYHSVNTCILSLAVGRLIGLEHDELLAVGAGAVLHDIGKVAISTATLNYPGRLSEEQWMEVKLHPQEGAQAILAAAGPRHAVAAAIALEHHTRYDGTGYPNGNERRRPHLFSRLVAVADVYDAITTRRSYRRAETPNRALHVLADGAGTVYDPDMVRRFVKVMGLYPPGSVVRLSSGELMVVTHHRDDDFRRLHGVIAKDSAGVPIDPEPIEVGIDRVADQILAERAGIDPASLVEQAGIDLQLEFPTRGDLER